MSLRHALRAAGACLAVTGTVFIIGCGKRGAPQPPLRPVPGAITDVAIERAGPRVAITFTVPSANADATTPAVADRIDVFAMTLPAEATRPGAADLIKPEQVVGSLAVAPVPVTAAPKATPTPSATPAKTAPDAPQAGQPAKFVEVIKDAGGAAGPQVRYYALVAMAGRRRGQATPIYAVRLAAAPAAPTRVTADYSESAITLEWPAGSAKQFIVEETDENGTTLEGGRREQVAGTTFRTDVEFGRRRCFVVRAADVAGAVSILGDPAAPACVTPTDKFPPPVPNDLLAIPTEEGIEVTWAAVTAADLSGYIVLRAEGANGTLQPVMTSPIAETAYRDRTVQSGVTYAYAIVAVDKASPPNRSAPSERKVATAR